MKDRLRELRGRERGLNRRTGLVVRREKAATPICRRSILSAQPFRGRSKVSGDSCCTKIQGVHRPWLASGPKRQRYVDGALRSTAPNKLDNFVEVFADKIPKTHGAPAQAALSS